MKTIRNLTAILLFSLLATAASAQYVTENITSYWPSQFSTSGEASIDLYNGRKLVAILLFLPVDEADLPAAYVGSNDGIIRLFYVADRYSDLLDLLRNGSGIKVNHWIGTAGLDNSHVATSGPQLVGQGAP